MASGAAASQRLEATEPVPPEIVHGDEDQQGQGRRDETESRRIAQPYGAELEREDDRGNMMQIRPISRRPFRTPRTGACSTR